MDYNTLTEDILRFLSQNISSKVNIVGYSMGAKVGMNIALRHPELVDKLICIDNAPVSKDIGPEFRHYLTALKQLEKAMASKRGSPRLATKWKSLGVTKLQELLGEGKNDLGLSMYLLDNLKYDRKTRGVVQKAALDRFDEDVLVQLGQFPQYPDGYHVENRSLFIRALQSGFVDDVEGVPAIEKLFPNNEIVDIDDTHAGLMANHHKKIKKLVASFLSN